MKIPTFEGIMTVVTTPFDDKGEIDFGVLKRHLHFLLEQGVHWIVPGGTTGEYCAQTTEERKKVMTFVAKEVRGKVRLAAGTNSARPAETLELSSHAEGLGYEALMLAAPYYSLPSGHELTEHYRYIASHTSLPIILYNFPARTGVEMDSAFLTAGSDIPAVCAIKESSGSFARMLEHITSFDKRFQRNCGADDQAVDGFLWGARSWIAGASNFLPAEHVTLYQACVVKKDFLLGQKLMHAMLPLFYLLEQGGKYLQFVKYGCESAGIPVGHTRRPLLGLSPEAKRRFDKLYKAVKSAKLTQLAA
jgi:4-hydroxy-tetrahydrodipicolinate synthase